MQAERFTLLPGDCMDRLRDIPDASVDACVTDPPYGLGFMGKHWDHPDNIAFRWELWAEVKRVLKPGGHVLAASGTRTYHRLAVAIEEAEFEIRDMVSWLYGRGVPKSLDVSKALDAAAGAEREVVGTKLGLPGYSLAADKGRGVACVAHGDSEEECAITAPATDAARQWQGWGTALKPACEPFVLARKPLIGTVAENVLAHGTGALNVDGCRVGVREKPKVTDLKHSGHAHNAYGAHSGGGKLLPDARWPANVIHDGSDEVTGMFPDSKAGRETKPRGTGGIWSGESNTPCGPQYGTPGSAARFFYAAKASKRDRAGSKHPTVKPIALMRYLCRLVTPPGGLILDPFAGTGTTGEAALLEGFRAILIEREPEYQADIRRRMEAMQPVQVALL